MCVWSEPTSHIYRYLHTYISSWTLYTLQLAVYTISTYIWSAPPWPGGYLSGASQGNTHQKLIKLQKLKKRKKLEIVFQFFSFFSFVHQFLMAGHSLAFPKSSSFNLQNCMVTVCVRSTQLHWKCGAVCICIAPVCLYCSHVCSSRLVYPLFAVPSAWHRLRRTWPSMIWKLPATEIFLLLAFSTFCARAFATWQLEPRELPNVWVHRCRQSHGALPRGHRRAHYEHFLRRSWWSLQACCQQQGLAAASFSLWSQGACVIRCQAPASCDRGKWWNSHHFEALPVPKQG